MFSGSVAFSGSRYAVVGLSAAVSSAVAAVAAAGGSVSVGCCVGADAAVIRAALAAGLVSRLSVFAAFGPGALGAGSVSDWSAVYVALDAGAAVHWWARGPSSVPFRARLVVRSLACVQSVAPSGGLVAFVAAPLPVAFGPGPWPSAGGSGSWSSVGAAARLGLPVVLVPVGGWSPSASALPGLPSPAGRSWSVRSLAGSWLWSPAPGLFG